MDRLLQDLRITLRGLRRTPAFTATAVTILGVGIGMSVAMFTVFDAVLLRKLPVQDQDRIVVMWTYRDPAVEQSIDFKDLEQLRTASRTMRDIAGVVHWGAASFPLLDGDRSLVLNRAIVSGNFFRVLGANAARGRLLRAAVCCALKIRPGRAEPPW